MKRIFYFSILVSTILLSGSCKKKVADERQGIFADYIEYDWFEYKGIDKVYMDFEKTDNVYFNPILPGFYPDPSICRVDDTYYLISSSFSYFPGIPIFESTDLVHWEQIGHVIHRKEQADFSGMGVSRGMFAPTIRYHNGIFYVICTNVDGGGNFIVTAKDPKGPWSDPIWIPGVNGIDPDLFFDDDGKLYITHNGPPPNNEPLHGGHRAIYIFEFDIEDQKIIGNSHLIVNGGTDMAKKPVWIEAPHIFKKDGYYYLICAEGGTGFNHSEVVFRSQHIYGPYISYENNPILTQRHLDPNRKNQVTTSGHADFVELPNGDWWSVFLACRPYGDDLYNTGRETFMMPVAWKDGWPEIGGGNDPIPFVHKRPYLPLDKNGKDTSGNFTIIDQFDGNQLDLKWNFIRTPKEQWYELHHGKLYIKPQEHSIYSKTNFSFIGRRQQHLNFEAALKLNYKLPDSLHTAGLVAFQNENYFLYMGKRLNAQGVQEVFLEMANGAEDVKSTIVAKEPLDTETSDLYLKIVGEGRYYNFYYKTTEKDDWKPLAKDVDASILSTKIAKGFVGTYLAMYASSNHYIKAE